MTIGIQFTRTLNSVCHAKKESIEVLIDLNRNPRSLPDEVQAVILAHLRHFCTVTVARVWNGN